MSMFSGLSACFAGSVSAFVYLKAKCNWWSGGCVVAAVSVGAGMCVRYGVCIGVGVSLRTIVCVDVWSMCLGGIVC